MDGGVGGKFWVESGGEDAPALDQDRLALMLREDSNSLPNFFDDGRADENHFEWAIGDRRGAGKNVAGKLASVAVPQNSHVEKPERILRGVLHMIGEEYGTGTGTKDGMMFGEFANRVVETFLLEELELCGGFAAGQNESVTRTEVGNGADFGGFGAEFAEARGVGGEVTLDGEDPDFGCGRLGHLVGSP